MEHGWDDEESSRTPVWPTAPCFESEDDWLEAYVTQYEHFPQTPAPRRIRMRAVDEQRAEQRAAPSRTERPWLDAYVEHYGHAPSNAQHLVAFVHHRGGEMSYTSALQAMGLSLPRNPTPWQDTLAINRHYRRLTRMIFTTLVLEEDPPGVNHLRGQLGGSASGLAAGLPMQVTMDLTKRLMELATPIEASESFLCTICLNGKTEEDAQVAWVQLACGHPLHRSCYRQLIHHNLFRCRCPLCRFDFLQLLLQET
ncbi:Dual specificity protein kinase shkE [Durusdinium trenchii]|uniref:Dual specificity protein kinase shkE n=1 Tax=Durusdinium trenchii TaxID=1381693 RepID=A0ABP0HZ54_9DINO